MFIGSYLFQTIILGIHVSFRECNLQENCIKVFFSPSAYIWSLQVLFDSLPVFFVHCIAGMFLKTKQLRLEYQNLRAFLC